MSSIAVACSTLKEDHLVPLPGSKSESNRALMINALCDTPGEVFNLAAARDTAILKELLAIPLDQYDARDAGTVMRFMTAYLAISTENAIISGTERMKQRPIGVLVEALQALGADISYLEKPGYPPLHISKITKQKTSHLQIDSSISSQFISALLMIAPILPNGLTLELTGNPVSTPYINMTLSIMRQFGVIVDVNEQRYRVDPQQYNYTPFEVEADWSGASYWYAIFALSNNDSLRIKGLKENSLQGDSILKEFMTSFGVTTRFSGNMAILEKGKASLPASIDFSSCPDLAQTFAVLCTGLEHKCEFTGLKTLKIKETDRVAALANELQKFGANFIEESKDSWRLIPIGSDSYTYKSIHINTYKDHRMAMAFAPMALETTLIFDDKDVVRKSYPQFWEHLATAGFHVE